MLAVLVLATTALVGVMYFQLTRPGPRRYAHPVLTPAGYALSAVAICVVTGSYIVTQVQATFAQTEDSIYLQAWVEGRRTVEKSIARADASGDLDYGEVHEGPQLKGYVFDSEAWSAPVYGYGGPMALVAFAEPNGVLIDFKMTRSQETPGYLQWLRGWMLSLRGRSLFDAEPLKGVDSISGATLSSQAILKLLRNSGQQFARTVLAQEAVSGPWRGPQVKTLDWHMVSWLAGWVLALGAIYHGRVWSRVLVLVYVTIVSGFWLNRQYALDQVMRLLRGEALLSVPLASLCLLLGVPLLVFFSGNIYCGYLCPFGALQELLGLMIPKRYKPKLSLHTVTSGRFLKYGLLFVLVLAFFVRQDRQVPSADPLVSFFNLRFWSQGIMTSTGFIIALVVLAGGLFVTRLWCRYLCPTGAFLSLFNLVAGLKRLFPLKKWGRCEFGLSAYDHLDCIYCDRCRFQSPLIPLQDEVMTPSLPNLGSRLFLLVLVCLAVVMGAPAWHPGADTWPSVVTAADPSQSAFQGEPRDVDMERIEQMIQQGRLSDKEALFYKRGPEDGNQP